MDSNLAHNNIKSTHLAAILGVSHTTIAKWVDAKKEISLQEVVHIPQIKRMVNSRWIQEHTASTHRPDGTPYTSIELFAGAGGLALGIEQAGFRSLGLVEVDPTCCNTLRNNRPDWSVIEADVRCVTKDTFRLSSEEYTHLDLISGGFPCQAFSYAGKQGGFEDTRGTLFFELARLAKEMQPKALLCENVKGLLSHDGGRTLQVILQTIKDIGYTTVVAPQVLNAVMYKVPQKRERLFIIAVRNDLIDKASFMWPSPYSRVMTLRDAFFAGELYEDDVPPSDGAKYPVSKERVMALVPMGGYWRDLPLTIQKEYMGKSFSSGGGRTGMARRLDYDEPSLTLTCAPSQKQTERAHPEFNRPLSIREYARIQTFPDEWFFAGSLSKQYAQIGNAVPVNLARAVASSVVRLLEAIYQK